MTEDGFAGLSGSQSPTEHKLRCEAELPRTDGTMGHCLKLLADMVTAPYRLKCNKCGAVTERMSAQRRVFFPTGKPKPKALGSLKG